MSTTRRLLEQVASGRISAADAQRELARRDQAKRARKARAKALGRHGRAPGKTAAERRAERDARWDATRSAVAQRVDRERQGRCEWTCERRADDPHHILGGSKRRFEERPETVAGVCRTCHRAYEANDEDTLNRAFAWARDHGFWAAARVIEARIEKVVALNLGGGR